MRFHRTTIALISLAWLSAGDRRRRELITRKLALMRLRMSTRERNYLTSGSLIRQVNCFWIAMYESRDSGSFINTVSIPPESYDRLLHVFARHYRIKAGPGRRGRPPKFVSKNNVLACWLHFYSAAIEQKTLCEMFGAPPSTSSRVLKKAEKALALALTELPDADVRWPSLQTQRDWAIKVNALEPLIDGCFCVADGKNYIVQSPSDSDTQNARHPECIV